jgi:hypothetical protein
LLSLNVDEAGPLELDVLELEVAYSVHLVSIPGISAGIGDDSTAPDAVVK